MVGCTRDLKFEMLDCGLEVSRKSLYIVVGKKRDFIPFSWVLIGKVTEV